MKIKTLFMLSVVAILAACSPEVVSTINSVLNPLGVTMKDAMTAWDAKKAELGEPSRDEDGTWLDVGVRYKYAVLKEFVNIRNLERVTGHKVYVKGPHDTDLNYDSDKIGYYNPDFLRSVSSSLTVSITNEAFNKVAQKFYDSQLKQMTRTYYRAYTHVNNNANAVVDDNDYYDVENFRSYADSEEKAGYDWYESIVAPAFWVRRKKDGTDMQFLGLITMVLEKYDPDFK